MCPCMDGARVGGAHDYAELMNLAIIPPNDQRWPLSAQLWLQPSCWPASIFRVD